MSSTDTADEGESMSFTPLKKRSKRGHLDSQTKEMIFNVYRQEMLENPELGIKDIECRTGLRTGVCFKTVFNIVREYKQTKAFSEPKRKACYGQIVDSVKDFDKTEIRRKVHQFYFRNDLPTIDKVLKEVNDDPDLPNFKRTTFWKLLKRLNFKFETWGRNREKGGGRSSMLLDEKEIVLWRRDYLRKIKKYRNEGRKIYYMDETCINAGDTEVCVGGSASSSKKPSGGEKRLIICHIGSEDGFVPDALWAFQSTKPGDYHDEITGGSFEAWFANTLPKLEDNCVIVLDNAAYHSRKLEKIPTATSKLEEIQTWLLSKNIKFNDQMLKVELLALVKEHKKQYDKLIIDEIAKQQNKTVLRLPPYHCELNPIELIWTDIKHYVVDRNQTFEFADVEIRFNEALSLISPEKWQHCIEHVRQRIEPKIWELDNIIEVKTEPIVSDGGSSSSISELESE